MLYEDLMMDSSMKTRYNMLRLLTTIDQGHYSIFYIAQKLNLTYQQAYHHLNELNREIQQAQASQKSILIKNSDINTTALTLSLDEYRFFLLQESVPFRFIQYTVNDPRPSLAVFCDDMYVSRSTLSRKIKPLVEFLKQFDVRISYTQMSLVGDETTIRLILFYIMWLGTRGMIWPFSVREEQLTYFEQHFNSFFSMDETFVGHRELEYFYAISYLRMHRHFFAPYNPDYDFIFKNSAYFDLQQMDNYPSVLPPKTAMGECSFLYFIALFAPYFTDINDPVLENTLKEFSRNPNPVWDFASSFIAFANANLLQHSLSDEDHQILLGNLIHVAFSQQIFGRTYPSMQAFVAPPRAQVVVPALKRGIRQFFLDASENDAFAHFFSNVNDLESTYTTILSPYYANQQPNSKLRVTLAIEHNHLFVQQLNTFLSSLNFVEFSPFVDSAADVDLIIGSSFALKQAFPAIPFYYWDLDYNYEELVYLYQTLRRQFVIKNQ